MVFVLHFKVFKNHGASAGASMSHSHSQILALPIIPSSVSARFEGMNEYFEKTGKCSLCEVQAKELLIDESTHFISIVPFAATFPFEIWIIPRAHSSHFHEFDCEKVIFSYWFCRLNPLFCTGFQIQPHIVVPPPLLFFLGLTATLLEF
jgi:UDPglucose--hexose-1-phosphate uridylyltransferase